MGAWRFRADLKVGPYCVLRLKVGPYGLRAEGVGLYGR